MYDGWQLGDTPFGQEVEKLNPRCRGAADPTIKLITDGVAGRWRETRGSR
jgi:hypothetical protein